MTANLYEISKGKKDTVVDFVQTKFKEQRQDLQELHRSWLLNLAWTRGYQNVDYDLKSHSWIKQNTNKSNWKVRLISNILLPLFRKNVAKLSYIHPVWDVIPATPDQEDIEIARIGTKVLQNIWQLTDMSKKMIQLLSWQEICSSAFIKTGWDTTIGDEIQIVSKELEEKLLQQFLEMYGIESPPETIDANAGECFIDVVPPFQITVDSNANIFEDTNWVIESQVRSLDWIVEKFGNKWKDKLTSSDHQDLLLFPTLGGSQSGVIKKKGVLTHEFFIKKTKQFKKGLYCFIAGEEVIVTPKDNPFEHGQLPYTHFLSIFDPSSLWGTCVVEQTRPNQATYNRMRSGMLENINLNSNIQWKVPHQAEIKAITNRPGEIIRYRYPYEPDQISPKPIPAHTHRFLDQTRLDIQDTASSHDVSEAKAEPGIRSGKAVLALQDADDSVFGPVLLWFDESLARVGQQVIQTVSQYVTEERTIYITGEFNQIEAATFTGAMLQGKNKANYWKVRVKTFGRQALSRSGRQALADDLIRLQILNPVVHREQILHVMGTADLLSIYDTDASIRAIQYDEIQQMIESGQLIEATLGEKHLIHKEELQKFISSGRFKRLDPQQQQLITRHLISHIEREVDESILPQQLLASKMGVMNGPNNNSNGNSGNNTGNNGRDSGNSGSRNQTGSQTRI